MNSPIKIMSPPWNSNSVVYYNPLSELRRKQTQMSFNLMELLYKISSMKSGVTSILKTEKLFVNSDSTIGSDRQSHWSLLNRCNTSIAWEIYCSRKIKAAIMDWGEIFWERGHEYTRVWFITWSLKDWMCSSHTVFSYRAERGAPLNRHVQHSFH